MTNTTDIYNLAYSCLIDGCGEHKLITLEEASYTLQCWQAEGSEIMETDSLTPEAFMMAWNDVLKHLRHV